MTPDEVLGRSDENTIGVVPANCEKQAIQRILVRSGVARVPGSSRRGRPPCGPPWCFWSVSRGSSARRGVLRFGHEPVRHAEAPMDRGRSKPEDQGDG